MTGRLLSLTVSLMLALAVSAPAQTESVYLENRIPSDGVEIAYDLAVGPGNRHIYHVGMTIGGIPGPSVRVSMPAWAPGAYRIVDYARNVQDFRATSLDGRNLQWRKIDKDTWEITRPEGESIRILYELYSDGLTPQMADLAGPATYMYVEGHKHVPVTLRYQTPEEWTVYTGLAEDEGIFSAPDYDVLIDAHAFIGPLDPVEFTLEGEVYRLIFSESEVRVDLDRLVEDVRNIVRAAVDIFGDTPFSDYTFFLRVGGGSGSGGLEHLNSTRITVGRNDLADEDGYRRFLYVVAHEFFHVWNVKWIRPEGLGPFDYSHEVYTPLLWVSEGITSYYGRLLLRRAGILTPAEYLEDLSTQIGSFRQSPGRFLMSNEEASRDAWLSSDNAENNSISYYTKGEIAGALLDLEIQQRTGGASSLDDVMRYMMDTWAREGLSLPEDGFLTALEAVTGTAFDETLDILARERGEPDYDRYLRHAGLELASDPGPRSLYMGVRLERAQQGRARIGGVVDGSPAQQAGLDRGDILISIDGRRVTMETLTSELNEHDLGDTVEVGFRRGTTDMTVDLTPIENPMESSKMSERSNATDAEQALREAWLAEGP